MNKEEIEKQLKELIETKHKELNLGKDYTEQFSKIRDFEGNAVGQIGEDFFKHILSKRTKIIFGFNYIPQIKLIFLNFYFCSFFHINYNLLMNQFLTIRFQLLLHLIFDYFELIPGENQS